MHLLFNRDPAVFYVIKKPKINNSITKKQLCWHFISDIFSFPDTQLASIASNLTLDSKGNFEHKIILKNHQTKPRIQ